MIKNLVVLFLSICLFSRCEVSSIDTSVLPEETQIGKGTFGCLIDGWVYVGGRYGSYNGIFNNWESIHFTYYEDKKIMCVYVILTETDYLGFIIEDPQEGKSSPCTNVDYNGEHLEDCVVEVSRFDNYVISGTFAGGKIRLGRFDMMYNQEG